MYFVSEISEERNTEDAPSLPPESATVPLAPRTSSSFTHSTSHPIEKFSVGKGLPLFPSRGRFTLIQVTPAKSGSDRWIRVLNYYDAHGRVSRPPRRKLKSHARARERHSRNLRAFHSPYPRHLFRTTLTVGIDIFTPPVCSSVSGQNPARARLCIHIHARVNNFPLSLEMNGPRRFQFAQLRDLASDHRGGLKKRQREKFCSGPLVKGGGGREVERWLLFLVEFRLCS